MIDAAGLILITSAFALVALVAASSGSADCGCGEGDVAFATLDARDGVADDRNDNRGNDGAIHTASDDAVGGGDRCPEGMAFVPGGETIVTYSGEHWDGRDKVTKAIATVDDFCIDIHEASQPDATDVSRGSWHPNHGTPPPPATSRPGVRPWVVISHDEASRACAAAGKRLPTLVEWQTAFSGHDGALWPWGTDVYDKTHTCLSGVPFQPYPTGACCFTNCRGDTCWRTCDMMGDVSEWTATDWNPECPANATHKIVAGGNAQDPRLYNSQYENPVGSGCWTAETWAQRRFGMHGHDATTVRYDDDGFRCAATPGVK
ncbi:formylglycine-generating enzyme family protein [bacterium]|nr:formylglycine-generating enzyme family protein [bacterium]